MGGRRPEPRSAEMHRVPESRVQADAASYHPAGSQGQDSTEGAVRRPGPAGRGMWRWRALRSLSTESS